MLSGDVIIARESKGPEWWLAALAVGTGLGAWAVYFQQDLVLSHYDAKAHLVVARRVVDNITPGWRQIGAVWLPLPHLLQVLPTQLDAVFRTGIFGSWLSVACLGVSVWAAARLVFLITASTLGALTSASLLALNPNLLYLHTTPLTEPLLLATTFLVVLWLYEWVAERQARPPAKLALALFAAAWTRYEAWPVIACAIAAAAHALWRSGVPVDLVARRMWRITAWPVAAGLLFALVSRLTVGSWFVSGGFFVTDPTYEGQAWKTTVALWWGTHQLGGYAIEIVALITAGTLVWRGLARGARTAELVPVALFAAGAIPFVAFFAGHPYRMRYMVPLAAACALFGGIAAGCSGRLASGRSTLRRMCGPAAAALLLGSALVESPPWSREAPLIEEAQSDAPASLERRQVTACLAAYHGEKVLASMGSLAHYMQELAHAGFRLADFVHEGNGSIWQLALETGPAPHVGWMLVEEEAEGGDVLAQIIRRDVDFARGMARVCEGGGVALYKRL